MQQIEVKWLQNVIVLYNCISKEDQTSNHKVTNCICVAHFNNTPNSTFVYSYKYIYKNVWYLIESTEATELSL